MHRALVQPLVQLLAAALAAQAGWAMAHGSTHAAPAVDAPHGIAVEGKVGAPAAGVTDLKFGEIFRMPVGPKGLEPSEKLLSLNGKPVRIVGYVATTESPQPGRAILSPLPVSLGDADEGLADDMPPSVVFVHLSGKAAERTVSNYRGLVQLTGTLQVGALDEPGGRVSGVRLLLDEQNSLQLLGEAPAKNKPSRKRVASTR